VEDEGAVVAIEELIVIEVVAAVMGR